MVEKVYYEESACFNCKHDKWEKETVYDEYYGVIDEWTHYCEVAGRSFEDGEYPKECPFFEEREKR